MIKLNFVEHNSAQWQHYNKTSKLGTGAKIYAIYFFINYE